MSDILTEQIIKQLEELPIVKKKAILELIKKNDSVTKKSGKNFLKQWRNELLQTSVWSDSESEKIFKAGEYLNRIG